MGNDVAVYNNQKNLSLLTWTTSARVLVQQSFFYLWVAKFYLYWKLRSANEEYSALSPGETTAQDKLSHFYILLLR